MALKPNRFIKSESPLYRVNQISEKGGIVCVATVGSGGDPSQPQDVVGYLANPSGAVPVGILMDDVVNPDYRLGTNRYRDEVRVGLNATVMTHGWVTTDMFNPANPPTKRQAAFVGASGLFDTVQATGARYAGDFYTTPDADGYVKIYVNLG